MLSLYDYLRAGHVKRWHIVNTATQQSIAEHSYLVSIIAMHLAKLMGCTAEHVMQTGIRALFHDITEIRTGDIPTPAKKMIKGIDPLIFDRIESYLMPDNPYSATQNSTDEAASDLCIKLADAIEAAHWIRENGLGRHAAIVADGCWRRVEQLTQEAECYEPVNEVLMALGMPYILREEKVSPP
jgi:5'-deoxynucleotidase